MKQIVHFFTSKIKFILVAIALVSLVAEVNAQSYTYSANYFPDAGNPGGINTEGDAPGLGTWNNVVLGPQATNIWSSVIFLPFPFDFYGEPQTVCFASQNGVVKFGNGFGATAPATVPGPNFNLPSVNFPDSAIGYWDEFTATPSTGGGDDIRTNTFGTAPNRQFWIRWYSFEMGNPTASFSYFAIVLEETTNKIYIVDQYSTATPSLSTTIGVQLNSTFGQQFGDSLTAQAGNGTAITDNDYWEFTPELLVNDNAGISAFANPSAPLSGGLQNVDVNLENFGTNVLDSVMINWEIDGAPQTSLNYTTAVPALGSVSALNIGTYNFPNGVTTLKAWTSMPNGVADSDVTNDTIEVELCTALNGTYTIGATSTDFLTITEAVAALANCGVAGPVVFNVEPGTYNGGYILEEIIGTSATSTITFDGGNAAILNHDATGIQAVWSFQGADYVTIKNFTINNTGTTDAWGVHLQNSSDYNTIDSCIFNMDAVPNRIDVAAIVASGDLTNDATEGDNGDYNTFSNNQINGGEYGIHLEGSSPTISSVDDWMSGIVISNNTFDLVDDFAIYGDNLDSLTVHGNFVDNMQNALNADALYFFDIQNFEITSNTIFANDWGIYIADGNFDGPTIVPSLSLIANNMVNAPNDYAVYLDDVNDVNIYHNTLKGEPAIRVNDNLRMDVRNNVFVSDGDYAFESDDNLGTNITIDYNMYWTPALNAFFAKAGTGTNIHSDLVAWQTVDATNNASSLELEPNFVSPTDFHMILVNGYDAGDNTAGITVDIDGDVRPLAPTAIVDMGADEWTPNSNDVGVVSIDNPVSPLSPGLSPVEVSVQNFGINNVDSVMIEWEINGTPQTTLNYTTVVNSAATNSNIVLGSFTFPTGFTNIKAWTSMPNSAADGENNNDTLDVDLCTALSGTYTAGGVGSDFTNIQDAVDALLSCGVSGPTTIEIQPGTYTGGYILTAITGASAANTVTFDGLDATTTFLTHDGTGIEAVWSFQGAEYVTIKNLDITHTGTLDAWGVHFQNQSNFNTIDSCVINMDPSPGLFDVASIVASGDLTNDLTEGDNGNFITISNNRFNGGEYGIHLEGLSPTVSSTNDWMRGINIVNNVFDLIDDFNIYVDNQDSITITGNVIENSQNAQSDGIYCFDIQNFDISGNTINANDWGIYIADGNFDGAVVVPVPSIISNNMVTSSSDYAIYLDDVNDVNMFHNSAVGNPALRMNDFLRFDIRNNIFSSNSDYAFETDDALDAATLVNYNMYWTPAGNFSFAKEGTAVYGDLSLWQAANATANINSVELEPFYASATDLHNVGGTGNDIGDNTVGITVDIDGDARPLAPSTIVDMGADEFTPLANDAVLLSLVQPTNNACGDSSTLISIEVLNLGSDTITSLPITIDITGDLTETVNFTYPAPIPFGVTEIIPVHLFNTYAGGTYTISANVALSGDQDLSSDTLAPETFTFIPAEPIGIDGYACGIDSGVIAADSTLVFNFDWYDAPTGGNLVGNGTTFNIPSISTQNTYYLEYGAFNSDLETTYADDNGCGAGNMFDINSTINTSISAICVNTSVAAGTAAPITVHYIVGSTYVGNETNPTAWTTQGSYSVTSAGTGNPTCFTLTSPIAIPAGSTVAVYIEYDARYTNLPSPSNYTDPSGAITVTTGAGFCNAFASPIDGRAFNGTITFGVTPCSSVRVPVTIPLSPSADLGNDTTLCDVASLVLDAGANAGFDILWSTTDTTQTTTAMGSGTYTLEVTDVANACVATDTIVITFDSVSVDLGPDTTNCSPTLNLDAGITGVDYAWTGGVTTQTLDVTSTGTYAVLVTNANGCTDSDSIDVVIENVVVDLGPDQVICDGDLATLDAGNAGAGFAWGDGETTQTLDVSVDGNYFVTVTTPAGCSDSDSAMVTVTPLVVSDFGIVGDSTNFSWMFNDASSNADSVFYDFGDGNGSFMPNPTNVYAGVGTYTVCQLAYNSCGIDTTCMDITIVNVGIRDISSNIKISLFPNPTENSIALDLNLAAEDNLTVQIFSIVGQEMYVNELTKVNNITSKIDVSSFASGTYLVKVTGKDGSTLKTFVKK